jgi:hypothetical protein
LPISTGEEIFHDLAAFLFLYRVGPCQHDVLSLLSLAGGAHWGEKASGLRVKTNTSLEFSLANPGADRLYRSGLARIF